MNTPTVLDSKGQVLEVGSRVERAFGIDKTGGMVGEVGTIEPDGRIWVTWNKSMRLRSSFQSNRRFTPHRTYRCPDLTLTLKRKESAPR